MLIVSQNGKQIVSTNTIDLIDVAENNSVCIFQQGSGDFFVEIATYESETDAKKALQKLLSAYASGEKVFFME